MSSGQKKIYVLLLVLIIIIGAAIYYFIFMKTPKAEYTSTASLQASLPKIDTSALQSPVFQELKSYKALPVLPDRAGNPLPFQEINFLGSSTPTQTF